MKKEEIKVGGIYLARVGVNITQVRVDEIQKADGYPSRIPGMKGVPASVRYQVTNLKTGRKTTFRSAMKFRKAVSVGQ